MVKVSDCGHPEELCRLKPLVDGRHAVDKWCPEQGPPPSR